ncbi:MAG TPA: polysaccharide biosynthesis/export family protein [Candidatus Methylacidiphilales bacterium]|nr:polysaccharide biosynthesis/export family protein [Candidatus Methylacidiphilales bacterium]
MKTFCRISLFVFAALLSGCLGGSNGVTPTPGPVQAGPAPVPSDVMAKNVMRVGDTITIRLTGVPDGGFIDQMQIPESGQIHVELLEQSFIAAGTTAADLAAQITQAYKTQKIYTTPVVLVTTDASYVNVYGDVRNPSRVVLTPDLTLLTAIISCGGFDEYADRRHVRITRGKQLIVIDAINASRTPGADPPVYAGDQIYVPRTPF